MLYFALICVVRHFSSTSLANLRSCSISSFKRLTVSFSSYRSLSNALFCSNNLISACFLCDNWFLGHQCTRYSLVQLLVMALLAWVLAIPCFSKSGFCYYSQGSECISQDSGLYRSGSHWIF